MNKISLGLNIILITVLLFMAFKSPKNEPIADVSEKPNKGCINCDHDDFYGVTLVDFIQDIARYKQTHWQKINDDPYMMNAGEKGTPMEDARSCWYSLDTLKKFICLIEKYSKIPSRNLGIRFYYATYPNKDLYEPAYMNHHTIMMVPTFNEIDFDPRFSFLHNVDPKTQTLTSIAFIDPTEKPLILEGSGANGESGRSTSSQTTANTGENQTMVKNQGQLCPPTCYVMQWPSSGMVCGEGINGLRNSTHLAVDQMLNNAMDLSDCLYPKGIGFGSNKAW